MNHYQVTERVPLRYRDGSLQPHLSAASGVAWLRTDLWVVDDASVFAGIFPRGNPPGIPVRLFPSIEGHDVFAEDAGTKRFKPDIEVLTPLPDGSLLAMGSGSARRGGEERQWRTRAARIRSLQQIEIVDLISLFELLSQWQEQLNLEGAVATQAGLLLFLRGNGIGGSPAVAEIKCWESMLSGKPELASFSEVALPSINGCPYGFTDACRLPGGEILAALTAETTSDVYADGPISGSALYDLRGDRLLPLLNRDGTPFREKLEGICACGKSRDLIGITDSDDPDQPGQLLRLRFVP